VSSSENNSQYLREEADAKNFRRKFMASSSGQNGEFSPLQSGSESCSNSKISNKPLHFGDAQLVKKRQNSRSSSMDSTKIQFARDTYFGKSSLKSFKSADKISSISLETCEDIFVSYQDDLDFMEESPQFSNL
jgi:hypothetical protein